MENREQEQELEPGTVQGAETPEVAQMKAELASLKYILSEKLQVEDRMIRRAMARRIDEVQRKAVFIVVLSVLTMWFAPWCFSRQFEISAAFVVGTDLMLGLSAGLTVAWHLPLRRIDWAADNLVTVAETVQRFRRRYVNWPKIWIPMCGLWLLWLLWEMHGGFDTVTFWYMTAGVIGGALVGGACGLRINQDIIRHADEVLAQIAELKQ